MRKDVINTIDVRHFRVRNHSEESQNKLILNKRECSKDNFQIIMKKHRQSLPPITSPFLKKTVYGLFSDKNLKQTLPLVHSEENQSCTIVAKSHNSKEPKNGLLSTNEHQYSDILLLSNETGLLQKSKKLQSNLKEKQPKFIKSISEVRHQPRYQLNHLARGQQSGQTSKVKNGRTSTEHSNMNSKSIYRKLEDLNEKQEIREDGDSRWKSNAAIGVRVSKAPNFVTKQKMARQLYGSQREDIKLVKSILKPSKGRVALDQVVRVKNYTKFIPGVISISN